MKKRIGIIALILALLVSAGFAAPAETLAASKSPLKSVYKGTYYPKDKVKNYIYTGLYKAAGEVSDEDVIIKTVSNSDPSVAKLTVRDDAYMIKLLKAGTTTMTVKVKSDKSLDEDGEPTFKTVTFKVKSSKYVNPLRTIKVGNKSYKKKLKTKSIIKDKRNVEGQRLKVKAKKGWKILNIYSAYNVGEVMDAKKLKNGSRMPRKHTTVTINVKNKKTGIKEDIILDL